MKGIAARAGVSVGTLYQYFPNKGSLHVFLTQQLDSFVVNFDQTCTAMRGAKLTEIVEALGSAFVKSKFGDAETSVALYAAAGSCDSCRRMQTQKQRPVKHCLNSFRMDSCCSSPGGENAI